MATLSHSESRRLYSWWWDSHISPKNSKWLQENLTDMDAKVKAMIKLIEEDADSFARRAEMYYKKRPELMKLVEEFYRAYRALAERYDHATVELRHAHRTMAAAFPNQVPYVLAEDMPSGSSGPDAEPSASGTHPNGAIQDLDDLQKDAVEYSSTNYFSKGDGENLEDLNYVSKRGLKQLDGILGSQGTMKWDSKDEEVRMRSSENNQDAVKGDNYLQEIPSLLSSENQNLKAQTPSESWCGGKVENEVQNLKKTLTKIQCEKDTILRQYQQSLEKLSNLEMELCNAQKDARGLDEHASKAEIEIKILKEALAELKAESDARLLQYNQCLERISCLETMLFVAEEEAKGLNERAAKAENDAQNLKQEISRLVAEKEDDYLQYKQCLNKISALENKISLAEENSRLLHEQIERAETEVEALKKHIDELNEEKEAVALMYNHCLGTMAKMEKEISQAQANYKRLNMEIEMGDVKLKNAEEHRALLENSNRSLHIEANNLLQKIAIKDKELSQKHDELERLQALMEEEHSHFIQIEASLQILQEMHSQSREEQKSLTLELKNGLHMLKDLELYKLSMEEEVQRVMDKNRTLTELNLSSTTSMSNMKNEISKLKEIEQKLEDEVASKTEESNLLQMQIFHLKDEIQGLSERYQAIIEQMESVGLNPQFFVVSVKKMQDENLNLTKVCEMEKVEKEALNEKLKGMDKLSRENLSLEFSLSTLNNELEGLRELVKSLQESCQSLKEEKSTLLNEKATLLSQLQITTENMQKLLEKNTLLENSLSGAKIELEGLRAKSSTLDEFCKFLNNEKSNLLNERSALVFQLKNVEERLGNLEKRFTILEEKCHHIEKEKDDKVFQVQDLQVSLVSMEREHTSYKRLNEARLAKLENHVCLLQEERRLGKVEFEEELEKAVNAQVEIFILQRFIEDLEEKNLALLLECQRHAEASKFSDKVILELENENLEHQMEVEFFLEEIRRLRMGIHQVCTALQIDPGKGNEDGVKEEEIRIKRVLDNVEDIKSSLVRSHDEKQQVLLENSILLTLIQQLKYEGAEVESKKYVLEQEFEIMREQLTMLQKDKLELEKVNSLLRSELTKGKEREEMLKSKLVALNITLVYLQGENVALQEENYEVIEGKRSLLKRIFGLKEENSKFEDENGAILYETVALSTLSVVLESFAAEKAMKLKEVSKHINLLQQTNTGLKKEVGVLSAKFVATKVENIYQNELVEKLEMELREAKHSNDCLHHQITIAEDLLKEKEAELSKVEARLKAAEALNVEFSRNVEDLKMERRESEMIKQNLEKQITELSEHSMNQKTEISFLDEVNRNLLSEIGTLHQEVEEWKLREETLSSELQEKTNEYELWEAEAATFYFDLQISSIHEVLLESKVDELSGVCMSLKEENSAKSMEIKQMTERVSSLGSEMEGLKGELSAYVPIIASMKEDLASLEHHALPWRRKVPNSGNEKTKDVEKGTHLHDKSSRNSKKYQTTVVQDGLSDLLNMQTVLRSVKSVMEEEVEMLAKEQSVSPIHNVEAWAKRNESSKLKVNPHQGKDFRNVDMQNDNVLANDLKSEKAKYEIGSMMKDIPLDQALDFQVNRSFGREKCGTEDHMLESWKTPTQNYCEDSGVSKASGKDSESVGDVITCLQPEKSEKSQDSSPDLQVEKELGVDKLELSKTVRKQNKKASKNKILERLASDAQKLMILQTNVQDLKKKVEANKRSKKENHTDYRTVKRKIQEVEGTVVQLVQINEKLAKDVEESASPTEKETPLKLEGTGNNNRKRILETAQRESEKIGKLHFEVQNIQYILLKLDDEKETKEKKKLPERKGTLLKDFMDNGKKSEKKRRKPCFCLCSRPSANEN